MKTSPVWLVAILCGQAVWAAEPLTKPTPFNTPEADAIMAKLQIFPVDSAWHREIGKWPLHPQSAEIVASVGKEKPLRVNPDMGFVLVPPDQPRVEVKIGSYAHESDPGPFPVPENVPVEGWPVAYQRGAKTREATLEDAQRDTLKQGGDRHAIVVDPVGGKLYEFYTLRRAEAGWVAAQASIFDLNSNKTRPTGWTSSDAAGLPLLPAVVRYDELKRGRIDHALRFTVRKSRNAFVAPATHYASRLKEANLPRMGERFRLRQDFDVARFSPEVRIILTALKEYGMIVADNGLEWSISLAPDERIPDVHEELRRVKGADFEVVTAPEK